MKNNRFRFFVNQYKAVPKKKVGKQSAVEMLVELAVLLRDNYIFFTAIPLIMGGLHQVISLFHIGAGYVRFFSITQLLSDGFILLLSLLVFLVVLALFATFIVPFYSNRNALPTHYHDSKGDKDGLIVLSHIVFFIFMFPLLTQSSFQENVIKLFNGLPVPPYSKLFIQLSFLGFLFIIFANIMYWFNWSQFRKKILFFINGVIGLFVFLILSLIFLHKLKDIIIPTSLTNLQNISCLIDDVSNKEFNPEILYFNDKFIFIKVSGDRNNIQLIPFDALFDSNGCR